MGGHGFGRMLDRTGDEEETSWRGGRGMGIRGEGMGASECACGWVVVRSAWMCGGGTKSERAASKQNTRAAR